MRAVREEKISASPHFTVSGRINKPVHEVFEAVVDPEKLSGYFTTGGAKGRIETGAVVIWDFHDFPGAFPVHIVDVIADEKIVLRWKAADSGDGQGADYETTVTMTFKGLEDGRTLVSIHETGWKNTPAGIKASYGNCEGWTGMLCGMRIWLEHGFNFRQGFYK